jgi:hypothetical protein
MFTPKRNTALSASNSARVTRSQSLKTTNNDFFSPSVNSSGALGSTGGRISLTMSSIYNDSILESYKSPLPIRVNELIFNLKSQGLNIYFKWSPYTIKAKTIIVHRNKIMQKRLESNQCNDTAKRTRLPGQRS